MSFFSKSKKPAEKIISQSHYELGKTSVDLTISSSFSSHTVDVKQKTIGELQPFPAEYIDNYVSRSGGYVNFCRFVVHGINPKTNRKTKYICEAKDEQQAIEITKQKKGLSEPFDVEVAENEPPTERQIAFAKELGITIPSGCCKTDLSFIISRVTDNDEAVADEWTVRNATRNHLFFSRYAGRKALSEAVIDSLDRKHNKK